MYYRLIINGKHDDSEYCIKCFKLKPYDDNDDLFGACRWTFDEYNICNDCFENLKNIYMNNSDYINFYGFNCNECKGWDGDSLTCDCGNWIVDWGYDPDNDAVYAGACYPYK